MNDTELDRALRSIGMACLVDHIELFGDRRATPTEIAERLNEVTDWTAKSCRSRAGHARRIFAAGRAGDAMRLVASSSRVDPEKAEKARLWAAANPDR